MINFEELKRLAVVYRRMCNLDEGMTPQKRGQGFNFLIAEVLNAYGIEARAATRRRQGEIDVYFSLNGIRFILEAKWEATAADEGAVSKLATRVRQSLQGTQGVLLSMAGFKGEALSGAQMGERLSVVMADALHFEALLAGVVTPGELFDGLIDGASFLGEPYTSLLSIIAFDSLMDDDCGISFDLGDCPPLQEQPERNASLNRLFRQNDWSQHGVLLRDQRVIVTTGRGLVEVDVERRRTSWLLHSRWCQNSAALLDDGRIAVVRRSGVVAIDNQGEVQVLGGGMSGNARLFPGPDGSLWASENAGGSGFGSGVSLTQLGQGPGQERTHRVSGGIAAPQSAIAVAATSTAVYIITQSQISKLLLGSEGELSDAKTVKNSFVNPGGLAVVAGRLLAVVETSLLVEFDSETLEEVSIISTGLGGSTFNICPVGDRAMLLTAPCLHGAELSHQAVIRVDLRS